MRISRLAERLRPPGSDECPTFWRKRFVLVLSPRGGLSPSAAGSGVRNGARCLQKGLQNQRGDGQILGKPRLEVLLVRLVINSKLQWDKVKELKKEICLFGMENHFKRKKNESVQQGKRDCKVR